MKLSISMPDELLDRLDTYADANFMTRSGAITLMVNSYLDSREASKTLVAMTEFLKDLKVSGRPISEEDAKQIEFLEFLSEQLPTK